MATGGYKLVKYTWQGGQTSSVLVRTKTVLHGFCSEIVNANLGWVWDTDFNDGTIDSYKTMGGHEDTTPNIAYILKLEYNSHVYRMCIAINYRNITALRDQDCVPYYVNDGATAYYQFTGTLYTGMIKDGTFIYDSTYGYIPDDQGQFLKWMTFNQNGSTTTNGRGSSFVYQNTSGNLYSYFALIKKAQVAIFCGRSVWRSTTTTTSGIKGYIMGELFKETAHTSDINTFACIYLCSTSNGSSHSTSGTTNLSNYNSEVTYPNSDETGDTEDFGTLINTSPSIGYRFIYSTSSAGYSISGTNSQIFTSNGTNLCGTCGYSLRWVQLRFDTYQVDRNVSNTINSPGGRWTPCYVYYYCTNQDTYGVVEGDSFKGFIDTDLLRGVNNTYSYGQLLGGGDFCYLGGGFAIGWDSSNTETLF